MLQYWLEYAGGKQIDCTCRNGHYSRVEPVEETTVARHDISRILDIIASLPLRLEKVAIDSCDTHDKREDDAVDKRKIKQSGEAEDHACHNSGEETTPEADP